MRRPSAARDAVELGEVSFGDPRAAHEPGGCRPHRRRDRPLARAAIAALLQLSEDDSLRVREAAGAALIACTPRFEAEP